MAGAIGTLGVIDTLTVGGCMFTDLTDLIVLVAQLSQASGNNSTPRRLFGSSGYQVTSGKTLTIRALSFDSINAASSFDFGYADNDVGLPSSTSFTNLKLFHGGTNFTGMAVASGSNFTRNIFAPIPSTKYAAVQSTVSSSAGIIMFYGYEA